MTNQVKAGKNAPEEFNVLIEIPMDSPVKYELDKEMNAIIVDRFAFTSMHYPLNYGFIPGTVSEDGDPIDVLVLSSHPVLPGCVITCRAVGMLEMEDEAGVDTKILAVPLPKVDPFYEHIKDIGDVSDAVKNKVKHFFEHYKDLEKGKWVKIKNWKEKKEATAEIEKSLK